MKVILVNPPYSVWTGGSRRLARVLGRMAPLGLLALAAFSRRRVSGLEIEILDAPALSLSPEETAREIVRRRPDVVGFTVTTAAVPSVQRISSAVKSGAPGTVTIAGGPHISGASSDPAGAERLLRDELPAVDFGVVGEGEETFRETLEAVRERLPFAGIRGLLRRAEGGKIIRNPPREPIEDLDSLPLPAWDLLPGFPARYAANAFFSPRGPAASLTTMRGCPFDCAFCDQSTFGHRPRAASAGYMVEAVRVLQSRYGARYIMFCDDTFALDRDRVMEFASRMAGLRRIPAWSCDANVMTMDRDMLRAMKRAGCWSIAFGLESGSRQVLESLNKRLDVARARRVVEETRAAGIHAKGLFIFGTPEETPQSVRQTQEFLTSLPLSTLNLSKFTPYPGSRLWANLAKARTNHRIVPSYGEMNGMNFILPSRGLSVPELERGYAQTLRMFYNRHEAWRVHVPIILRNMTRFAAAYSVSFSNGRLERAGST